MRSKVSRAPIDVCQHVSKPSNCLTSSSASIHLLTSLCDAALTSQYDTSMTLSASERLQLRLMTPAMDSDTSDCPDELVTDLKQLGVELRTSTTPALPDLATNIDAAGGQADPPGRRRQVRCKLPVSGSGDKMRRRTSSAMAHASSVTAAAVHSRLTCISRTKRRARVHAVC